MTRRPPPPPARVALQFDGATIALRLPVAELDRFYGEAITASPRERRALTAELFARFCEARPSYWWRGEPVARLRALTADDQDRVVAALLEAVADARRTHLPRSPRPASSAAPAPTLPPAPPAARRHGRS